MANSVVFQQHILFAGFVRILPVFKPLFVFNRIFKKGLIHSSDDLNGMWQRKMCITLDHLQCFMSQYFG